ncbi:MAG: crotonase/enoyl-CoA hydratase family protein [Actinomycetota bacterium]|nr:crotonase/enoyl-CoA hydratase family protein [Actinomycetota bacterium]
MEQSPGREPLVLVERRGHVAVVTLNRPEARNAIDARMALALGEAVEELDQDEDVRAVVLTGAGGKAFCAGADLKALARNEPYAAPGHEQWGFAGFVDHVPSAPVVAAVEGAAFGGGAEICLACDLVVAGEGARFALPEVRRGIIPGGGGLVRLPGQVPLKIATELVLTGREISAAEASRLGLVNRVVADGGALDAAVALAEEIGANAPLAVRAAKRVLAARAGLAGELLADRHAQSREERAKIGRTDDATEGARAFAERRAPRWTGR